MTSIWVCGWERVVWVCSLFVHTCIYVCVWEIEHLLEEHSKSSGGKATREGKESSKNKIQKPFRAENSVGDSAWTERQRRMKKKRAEGKGRKNVLFKPPARSGPGESVMQAGDRCFGNHTRPREAEFSEICVNVRCLIFPVTLCQ